MNPNNSDASESAIRAASDRSRLAGLKRYGLAVLSVAVALGASLLLQQGHLREAAFPLLLFAVAISAWYVGPGPAVLATILSIMGFYYYFIEPVRTIYIYPSEIPYFIIFVAFASLMSWFSTIRRRAESTLRERASLLNLTHDTVFVMDMEGVIQYWNRGAEERYGWPAEEALGRVVHDLLKTVFPAPPEQIKAELMRTGRWEGELVHTKRSGIQVVVASRWALQRDKRGAPVAILETSNDITERKRAEEALRRSNRELRALSNCNQTLLRATDEQSLLEEICRIVCEEAGYRPVWVSYVEPDEAKSVRPVAWAGADEAYLATAGISWSEDTERGRGPTGTAIRSGKTSYVQDFATDARVAPWRDVLLQGGFRSAIALPLKDEHGNVFGTLAMHSERPNAFTPQEIHLLEELAGDLAFGIVTLRSRVARNRAEQEVALLSFAMDNVREAALLVDERGRFCYVNEQACGVLGYTRAELLSMGVPDVDPEFPPGRWSDHWRDLETRRSLTFESRHRTRDGSFFPVEVSANYLEYEGRAYNLALVRDITERKRDEEALRLSNAYNRSLIEASLDPLVTIGPDGRITDVNAATEAATGRSRGELIGTDFCDYFTEPLEARLGYEHVFREGAVRDYPLELRHRDGRVMSVLYNASVYRDESGRVIGVFAAARDITERKRREEELRRTAAYLAETQRLTHTGTFVSDDTTRPLYWSEELFRIFGFDPQQGLPTREQPLQRIHPEDMGKFLQAWDRAIKERADTDVEFRLVMPDGTVKHAYGRGHPVLNANGELVEIVGTTIDISERKRAEEALRRSEAYLADAQRLSHTGSWALDPVTREYDYWSEEMFRLFGVNPEEGIPRRERMARQVHPEDWDRVLLDFEKSLQEKVDTSDEYRFVLPGGTIKHLQVIQHPLLDSAGDIVRLVGTFIDITERKRAEEALRESETRLRTFVDHAADAFFMLDFEQGTIVDVNRPACESLGYTRQELIGMSPLAFDVDLDRASFESTAERAAAGETVLFDRHWHRRKDESLFPVEVQTSVFWHGGRRFLLKVARDISDHVRAEEQRERLRQLEADLAHINRVSIMGELAASVAHEVNQPLSGVVSNASAGLRWLAGDAPNLEEAREGLRRIVRDGKRAGEVIARIRALTRKATTPREKLDLNQTIGEVLALIGDEAKRNSVMIRAQFDDDLSRVSGDRVQLQQVMLNLGMNAIEAMSSVDERARELVITTRNIDADQVQVTVEDSGPGLDPNTTDRIFDPFYTTKPGGMGMGLSISRSIIQAHDGRLWATARDGSGTSFHFTLPAYHEE
jgi:PAS domain S-box-containing protein